MTIINIKYEHRASFKINVPNHIGSMPIMRNLLDSPDGSYLIEEVEDGHLAKTYVINIRAPSATALHNVLVKMVTFAQDNDLDVVQ